MSKIMEINVIQNYPGNSLNRDMNGRPKTMFLGGIERNRISSQCLKRAMRELATYENPDLFGDFRSRNWKSIQNYIENRCGEKLSPKIVKIIKSVFLATKDSKEDKENSEESADGKEVMIFTSYEEFYKAYKSIEKIYNEIEAAKDASEKKDAKKASKAITEAAIKEFRKCFIEAKDNAEIAAYGRMVANSPSLQVEAFLTVANAVSTHKTKMEFDAFTAVDELTSKDDSDNDSGAGHMGSSIYSSFIAYRYASIDLDLANREDHLGKFDKKTKAKIIRAIVESVIYAFPKGKKTSFAAMTLPSYINILVREGQPVTHANAFVTPIRGQNILDESISKLKESIDTMFYKSYPNIGEKITFNKNFPDLNAKELVDEIEKHI